MDGRRREGGREGGRESRRRKKRGGVDISLHSPVRGGGGLLKPVLRSCIMNRRHSEMSQVLSAELRLLCLIVFNLLVLALCGTHSILPCHRLLHQGDKAGKSYCIQQTLRSKIHLFQS